MTTDKTSKRKISSGSDLPVSRKFYAGLLCRVDEILRAVAPDYLNEFYRQAKRLIDNYLSDNMHSIPDSEISPEVRIIFLTLKADIDRARQRSIRARQAAAARRSGSHDHTDTQTVLSVFADNEAIQPSDRASLKPAVPCQAPHLNDRMRRTGLKWKCARRSAGMRQSVRNGQSAIFGRKVVKFRGLV